MQLMLLLKSAIYAIVRLVTLSTGDFCTSDLIRIIRPLQLEIFAVFTETRCANEGLVYCGCAYRFQALNVAVRRLSTKLEINADMLIFYRP